MQKGSNSRRSRGRGNGGKRPQKNHNFDSSGPEGRVRGNAQQVYEKYVGLARDAQLAGDRIATENYFQHAEHYLRVLMAQDNGDGRMEAFRQRQQRLNDDEFGEGDEVDELSNGPQQNRAHQQGGYQGDGRPQQDMRQDGRQDRQDNRQERNQERNQEGRQDRQDNRPEGRNQEGRQEGRNPEGRPEGRQEGRRERGEGRQNNRNNNGEGRGESRAEGDAPRDGQSDAPREARSDAPREGRGNAPREGREGGNGRRVPIERAERATERAATPDEESDDDGLRRTLAI